ncbi:MAG: glycosyltransferase family 4 protein [Planctomycetota bacterium]|nr:MAG: glycosyltransferase family 4 protein [Planctomycetota bacterium]
MIGRTAKKVAFICSYKPRRCGIATFALDLINSLRTAGGEEFEPLVIAMESGAELTYDKSVKYRIRKDIKYDYISAADYINYSCADIVSIQHEFGLFGGEGGSHLNLLLKKLNKPVITTLHTVLEIPHVEYFESMVDVCEASEKVIVMNKRGIKMLRGIYGVPGDKIKLIPHGVPDLPFTDSTYYKRKLGLEQHKTILTFGLLSENKGIEVMLEALPRVVKVNPHVLYMVIGETHPEVLRYEGLSYKSKLEAMVTDLGLQRNVVFHNRFVNGEELFGFLGAADIYVTPYLNKEQLTSGTLAFAVGAGKAVVSTPYWAAEELLAQGRGKLVRFADSEHLARSIAELLSNDAQCYKMRKRAYEYGRSMTWSKVGQAYWSLFEAQAPSLTIPLRPKPDSSDVEMPAYNHDEAHFAMPPRAGDQQVYRSA